MSQLEGAAAHGNLSHLLPESYKSLIHTWLQEDTPSFDYGGFVVGSASAEAHLLAKASGIIAGIPFFDEVFRQLGCTVEWHVSEGAAIELFELQSADSSSRPTRQHCATVQGPTRNILLGERVALNILARSSGIATASASLLRILREVGYSGKLAATRKTTPGFRLVEKYAVLVGGCDPHRYDLSAMTMLKDNHIAACGGSITKAVHAAKAVGGFAVKVEVECQSYEMADEAIAAGADVVMLDNFEPDGVRDCATRLKDKWGRGQGARALVEISGGLTKENVRDYVCSDVDIISTSSIHQGVKHVDFSLKIIPKAYT